VGVAAAEGTPALIKDPAPKTAEQIEIAAEDAVVAPESKAPVEAGEPVATGPAAEEKLVKEISTPEGKDAPVPVPAVNGAFIQQVISMLQAQETARTDAEAKHQQLTSMLQAQ
jgi:hypothetical protein